MSEQGAHRAATGRDRRATVRRGMEWTFVVLLTAPLLLAAAQRNWAAVVGFTLAALGWSASAVKGGSLERLIPVVAAMRDQLGEQVLAVSAPGHPPLPDVLPPRVPSPPVSLPGAGYRPGPRDVL